jgi:hypothetical protein
LDREKEKRETLRGHFFSFIWLLTASYKKNKKVRRLAFQINGKRNVKRQALRAHFLVHPGCKCLCICAGMPGPGNDCRFPQTLISSLIDYWPVQSLLSLYFY